MATINLLPHRAERRRQREREFYAMLGAAFAAAVLAWLLWGYWMGVRIDSQDGRNTYLKDQIHQLDGKLAEIKELENTKSKLLARKQIIEQLQANRSQMVHLFDQMVKTIPEGTRLTSLKQNGDTLTLTGVAQANGNVASYMRSLDCSHWLGHSDLQKTEVKGTDQRNRYEFGLTVKLTSPEQTASKPCTGAEQGGAPDLTIPAANPPPAPTAPVPAAPAPTPPVPAAPVTTGGKP
jgi:type IV pilus assembly protein PilN